LNARTGEKRSLVFPREAGGVVMGRSNEKLPKTELIGIRKKKAARQKGSGGEGPAACRLRGVSWTFRLLRLTQGNVHSGGGLGFNEQDLRKGRGKRTEIAGGGFQKGVKRRAVFICGRKKIKILGQNWCKAEHERPQGQLKCVRTGEK